jgi:hypothetical protein
MPCSPDLPSKPLRLPSATSPDNSICSPPETIRANNRTFYARYLLPSRIFS